MVFLDKFCHFYTDNRQGVRGCVADTETESQAHVPFWFDQDQCLRAANIVFLETQIEILTVIISSKGWTWPDVRQKGNLTLWQDSKVLSIMSNAFNGFKNKATDFATRNYGTDGVAAVTEQVAVLKQYIDYNKHTFLYGWRWSQWSVQELLLALQQSQTYGGNRYFISC